MSVILSGLSRLAPGLEDQLNWDYFHVTDVDTVNGERNLLRLLINGKHEVINALNLNMSQQGPRKSSQLAKDSDVESSFYLCYKMHFFCTEDFPDISAILFMSAIH